MSTDDKIVLEIYENTTLGEFIKGLEVLPKSVTIAGGGLLSTSYNSYLVLQGPDILDIKKAVRPSRHSKALHSTRLDFNWLKSARFLKDLEDVRNEDW
jgi:hypothetical protein